MQPYLNLDGDAGVTDYEAGRDYLLVRFRSGKVYRYSHARAGALHVERLKTLAKSGRGLSTYISQYAHDLYDRD